MGVVLVGSVVLVAAVVGVLVVILAVVVGVLVVILAVGVVVAVIVAAVLAAVVVDRPVLIPPLFLGFVHVLTNVRLQL